ncbi:hypothetical protein [Devosia naphthalenivorans]|uniref:hypothetical protein n=1 Tax=Devosia naphthalenivorans TaxID=2082392 RepID=UPI000D39AA65|nr:hypothetical protein [Devosia naphthalenivorans]
MVDLSLLAGAASSLRIASDVASSLVGLRDHQLLQTKVIELQRLILDAQSSATSAQMQQMELVQQIRDLQKEIEAFNNWQAVTQRYELVDMGGDTFSYRLKGNLTDEPAHLLCTNCFEDRRKSVLQRTSSHGTQKQYQCPACKSTYWLGQHTPSPPRQVRRSSEW